MKAEKVSPSPPGAGAGPAAAAGGGGPQRARYWSYGVLAAAAAGAGLAAVLMVRFAAQISVHDVRVESGLAGRVRRLGGARGLVRVHARPSRSRPYLGAVLRARGGAWAYACTACLVRPRWAVAAAHCRAPGAHVLLYGDAQAPLGRNLSAARRVVAWKLRGGLARPADDLAVLRLARGAGPAAAAAVLNGARPPRALRLSVWRSLAATDGRYYATDEVREFGVRLAAARRCEAAYGVTLGAGELCVELAGRDCFTHECGPVFAGERLAGVAALLPPRCGLRLAVFTNVSHHAAWLEAAIREPAVPAARTAPATAAPVVCTKGYDEFDYG